MRNGAFVLIAGVVIVALVLLTTTLGNKSPSTTTTSTTTKASTAKLDATLQKKANEAAIKAGCKANPKTRTNTLSWTTPPPMTITVNKTYTAKVKTTAGDFTISLLAKTAPNTVNNFVFLAKQNYYNCVTFHRVIPHFMDQTGDPTGTGTGGPGYKFATENLPKSYATGDVAMANSGADTNGSQFFIVAPGGAKSLSSNYSLFGKVTSGLAVVEKINSEGNTANNGVPPKVINRILTVTITT
jgi:peptidylprolyl isomerase/peptidyl-prolyl cis-trans isomerase B (cyclophilin B)